MLRYLSAGESHGPGLTLIIEHLPARLRVDVSRINLELARRQAGYGRGARMQIEKDQAQILGGLRDGLTLGSPLALFIHNRDWENWQQEMDPQQVTLRNPVTNPRPGHADLPGAFKYHHLEDVRNVFERASARETATRVAAGAVARVLLEEFGVQVMSHVLAVGSVWARRVESTREELQARADASPLRCLDAEAEEDMKQAIDAARSEGDSLGGVFEVMAFGLPWGLGSHVHWDRKIDGRLAQAVMSVQGIKAVEIGEGFAGCSWPGSRFHDGLELDEKGNLRWQSNHAGGVLGGITTSAPLVVRAGMKPIPTVTVPLPSVDLASMEPTRGSAQRTDSCAVPAASVVGEAVVAWELAVSLLEKFGGDYLEETRRNFQGYLDDLPGG